MLKQEVKISDENRWTLTNALAWINANAKTHPGISVISAAEKHLPFLRPLLSALRLLFCARKHFTFSSSCTDNNSSSRREAAACRLRYQQLVALAGVALRNELKFLPSPCSSNLLHQMWGIVWKCSITPYEAITHASAPAPAGSARLRGGMLIILGWLVPADKAEHLHSRTRTQQVPL